MNIEMTIPQHLAAKAKHAIAEYAGVTSGARRGQKIAFAAILEYGDALADGRKACKGKVAFGEWVRSNGLAAGDPWADASERSHAMRIASIWATAQDAFAGCPHTRPSHIMAWYRKQHPSPLREDKAKATAKAARVIEELEAAGAEVTEEKVEQRAGVSASTAHKAVVVHKKVKAAKDQARIEMSEEQALAMAEASFSEKSRMSLAKAIETHRKKLTKQFEVVVHNEVAKRIAAADDAVRQQLAQLRKRELYLTKALQTKGVFSQREFRELLMCVHPDSSASTEVRNRLTGILTQSQARLVKPE